MDRRLILLIVAIGTAILGEVKLQPFNSDFRFGLGGLFYLLTIIYWYPLPQRKLGWIVACTTVLWRVVWDQFYGLNWSSSLAIHWPAAFYYITLTYFLNAVQWWRWREQPLFLGGIMFFADTIANLIEMLVRFKLDITAVSAESLTVILVVALCRGLIVIFWSAFILKERWIAVRAVQEHANARILVGSGLHMEVFYLHKSMANVETVMKRSHELYLQLRHETTNQDLLAGTALEVAKEVHEIKKDLRRIEEGLRQMLSAVPVADQMEIGEILELVAGANHDYALAENKQVTIKIDAEQNWMARNVFSLVSILNNLVQNAVEAIEQHGTIDVRIRIIEDRVQIKICDDGPGILAEDQDLVFEPGFTSKFNAGGEPSTGIGLTHVRSLVEHLKGEILLCRIETGGTCFQVDIPVSEVIVNGV